MTKPPGDVVAHHCVPDGFAHDQAEARAPFAVHGRIVVHERVHDEIAPTAPTTAAHHGGEVPTTTQAVPIRQQP